MPLKSLKIITSNKDAPEFFLGFLYENLAQTNTSASTEN